MNRVALLLFAPLLVMAGVLGFVVPPRLSPLSVAPAYNVFHIVVGAVGTRLALAKPEPWSRAFNVAFGAIDLYQAIASAAHLFPEPWFRWTRVDDVLHVVLGAGLIVLGLFGGRRRPPRR